MDSLLEEWRDVEGFPGYRVSSYGRIETTRHGKCLIRTINPTGKHDAYLRVKLAEGIPRKGVGKLVHRLVMEAFVGPSELQVNHIDGNKTNNRLDNLEYVTGSENNLHAYRTGLRKRQIGEEASGSKLVECEVVEIRRRLETETVSGIARDLGLNRKTIQAIKHGRSWSHVG